MKSKSAFRFSGPVEVFSHLYVHLQKKGLNVEQCFNWRNNLVKFLENMEDPHHLRTKWCKYNKLCLYQTEKKLLDGRFSSCVRELLHIDACI